MSLAALLLALPLAGAALAELSAEAAHERGHRIQAELSRTKDIAAAAAEHAPGRLGDDAPPPPAPPAAGFEPADSRDQAEAASGGAAARRAQPEPADTTAETSNFAAVWEAVKKGPLTPPYPKAKVSFWRLLGAGFRLLDSAKRTLDEHRDLLPHFDKLIRPNGIALAGTWEVTEETPYGGYFSRGSRAQVIARASVFSDDTDRGGYRSFGLALKLFPSADPADPGKFKTANVFLIDDNGGTTTSHFTDASLMTHPKLSVHGGVLLHSPILAAVALAQRLADKNPDYRQLYPISELGVARDRLAEVKTPERMKLQGAPGPRVDAADFREELDASKYPGGLVFDVFTADGEHEPWSRIGRITFTESAVSSVADHNLHFPHPRYKQAPAGYGGKRR